MFVQTVSFVVVACPVIVTLWCHRWTLRAGGVLTIEQSGDTRVVAKMTALVREGIFYGS